MKNRTGKELEDFGYVNMDFRKPKRMAFADRILWVFLVLAVAFFVGVNVFLLVRGL